MAASDVQVQHDKCRGHLNNAATWKNHVRIRRFCKSLVLSNRKLREIMKRMRTCIDQGLGKDTHPTASIKCWQTFVQDMPTGNEDGKFLALDLGGSNFRILYLELGPNNYFKMDQTLFDISKDLMTGKGSELFDYIADCLNKFVSARKIQDENPLPLGFTFSFPMSQLSIDSGTLVRWTKGFTCDNVVNQDVVKLLTMSINNIPDLKVQTIAILNDTVGTLMSCAWKNPKTRIGLIVGTGCNCCYIEKVQNIEMYNGDSSKNEMVINLEWGAFGDQSELQDFYTKYDQNIDSNSENKGQQIFEKMVSGMYLGELFRLVLVDLIENNLLLDGYVPPMLGVSKSLTTDLISLIENDPPGIYTATKDFLEHFGVENPTDGDCMNVRYIAETVSKRSAHLVAAGLAVILNKMNEKDVTIGVDGSVYRYHPFYHQLMVDKIKELANCDIKFDMILSEDGSGRGAAVLASSLAKQ